MSKTTLSLQNKLPTTSNDLLNLLEENRMYHIRGIATHKGIKYLEQKLKND